MLEVRGQDLKTVIKQLEGINSRFGDREGQIKGSDVHIARSEV
jgi:hypothetical protein